MFHILEHVRRLVSDLEFTILYFLMRHNTDHILQL